MTRIDHTNTDEISAGDYVLEAWADNTVSLSPHGEEYIRGWAGFVRGTRLDDSGVAHVAIGEDGDEFALSPGYSLVLDK